MAVVHRTTLSPSKLELLSAWLPAQEWFRSGDTLDLVRAGGFRLDDPAGEVGMEFGTTEHGVLGRRWVYDGARDPVLVEQALALLTGRARAQDQDVSNTLAAAVDVIPAAVDAPISLRVNRIPGGEPGEQGGRIEGAWRNSDGVVRRGILLEAVAATGRN